MENRLDEAIDHFEEARALDPENKAVYSHLATAYRRKGKSGHANAMLAMLVKLNDQDRAHVYPVSKLMKGGSVHDPPLQELPEEVEKESKAVRRP